MFRCNSGGDLYSAELGAYDHWWQAYIYIQGGDMVIHKEVTPYWDEFISALVDSNVAMRLSAGEVLRCIKAGRPAVLSWQ